MVFDQRRRAGDASGRTAVQHTVLITEQTGKTQRDLQGLVCFFYAGHSNFHRMFKYVSEKNIAFKKAFTPVFSNAILKSAGQEHAAADDLVKRDVGCGRSCTVIISASRMEGCKVKTSRLPCAYAHGQKKKER